MDIKKCKICDGPTKSLIAGAKDFFVLRGDSPDFGIDFCKRCGVGFSVPPMDEQELERYYPGDYEAYVGKRPLADLLQRWKYAADLRIIVRNVKGRRLLEIGCGRGEFLYEAKKLGYEIDGVDPSPHARNFASSHFGISVRPGFAQSVKFEKRYDVIVMRHALEHVNDFRRCLVNIAKNGLSQGGVLFLKLPRMDSWEARFFGKYWDGYDLPRHRIHFTKKGITSLLIATGFEIISIASERVPYPFVRSLDNYGKKATPGLARIMARLYSALPKSVKIIVAAGIVFLCAPFSSGRMIITAKISTNLPVLNKGIKAS